MGSIAPRWVPPPTVRRLRIFAADPLVEEFEDNTRVLRILEQAIRRSARLDEVAPLFQSLEKIVFNRPPREAPEADRKGESWREVEKLARRNAKLFGFDEKRASEIETRSV